MDSEKNVVANEQTVSQTNNSSPSRGGHIVKNVALGVAALITAFLLVVTVTLGIDKFVNKAEIPSFCGYSSLVVISDSMSGTIEKGDFILIKEKDTYSVGAIITFAHEGEDIPTTHRIYAYDAETDSFITRGDALGNIDTKRVSKNEIYGEVVANFHALGLVAGWLTSGGGYIYVVTTLVIISLGVFLIKDENNRHLYLASEEEKKEEEDTASDDIDTNK